MMKFGSHNTMSYLPPKHWWMYFGRFIYRCQSKTLQEQLQSGIHFIDLRVKFDNEGKVMFGHGIYTSKMKYDMKELTEYVLNSIKQYKTNDGKFYIRLILETSEADLTQEIYFIKLVKEFDDKKSDDIELFGGNRKFDWKHISGLILSVPSDNSLVQLVSSMATDSRWYEKICPIAYAKRMNKTNMQKWTDTKALIAFDFI